MEEIHQVHWYFDSHNDVLRLPMPEEVRRAEVEVFIYREAETLAYWAEREPQVLGLFPWSWVDEDLRIAQWVLGDWFRIFRDLRFFFYVHEAREAGGDTTIHILAVQEDGANYVATEMDQLRERCESVLTLLGESEPGMNGGET